MILYVNGDSHSAGAEAVLSYCFAEEDQKYKHLGRKPHPINLTYSYGNLIAQQLNAQLVCDAESASSNDRIIRTTNEYLKNNTPDLIIIGWSTWERQEWFNQGIYWQVNSAPAGFDWPDSIKQQHKEWVLSRLDIDYEKDMVHWHEKIYNYHLMLNEKNIKHIFFNTFSNFEPISTGRMRINIPKMYNWGDSYVGPYQTDLTYYYWLKNSGFEESKKGHYHYKSDGHRAWADFIYQNYVQKVLTKNG